MAALPQRTVESGALRPAPLRAIRLLSPASEKIRPAQVDKPANCAKKTSWTGRLLPSSRTALFSEKACLNLLIDPPFPRRATPGFSGGRREGAVSGLDPQRFPQHTKSRSTLCFG